MKHKLGVISLTLTALALPMSMVMLKAAEFYLKNSNAQAFDITARSAYQQASFAFAITGFCVMIIGAVLATLIALKNTGDSKFAKKSLLLITSIIVLVTLAFALQYKITELEKSYSKKRINQFFQSLSQ